MHVIGNTLYPIMCTHVVGTAPSRHMLESSMLTSRWTFYNP